MRVRVYESNADGVAQFASRNGITHNAAANWLINRSLAQLGMPSGNPAPSTDDVKPGIVSAYLPAKVRAALLAFADRRQSKLSAAIKTLLIDGLKANGVAP